MTTSSKGLTLPEVLLVVAVLAICAAVVLPLLAGRTNCGGNSAALSACRHIALSFQTIALDHGDQPFSIKDLTSRERENFRDVMGLSWLPGARILVAPGPMAIGEGHPKRILAVCDHAFDNVPRRILGRSPATHAVAYSNGSTGLMSMEEFRRSDLGGFVDIRTIAPGRLEPGGAANRSQPIGPETNQPSAAAGSGR
jgi:prepilin-type N-terminal cleavage/methylation domain-containing protein